MGYDPRVSHPEYHAKMIRSENRRPEDRELTFHECRDFTDGRLSVEVWSSAEGLALSAAAKAAELIKTALQRRGIARILVSTGNSQIEFIAALAAERGIDWSRVEVFHLDEYVGMPNDHPASFRRWIKTRVADQVHPYRTHYLGGDAADLELNGTLFSTAAGKADRRRLHRDRRERPHCVQ